MLIVDHDSSLTGVIFRRISLHKSANAFLIPLSNINRLQHNLRNTLGIPVPENGHADRWERDILWCYETTLGEVGESASNVAQAGPKMMKPLVYALLSSELTSHLDARHQTGKYGVVMGHMSVRSSNRSMNWEVVLVPDAFDDINEMVYADKHGHLTAAMGNPVIVENNGNIDENDSTSVTLGDGTVIDFDAPNLTSISSGIYCLCENRMPVEPYLNGMSPDDPSLQTVFRQSIYRGPMMYKAGMAATLFTSDLKFWELSASSHLRAVEEMRA